jgi:hypothetical protein
VRTLTTTLIMVFAAAIFFGGEAAAGHVQQISRQSAVSMCSSAGGGTTCGYCDHNHCHEIDCNEKGKCYNTVVTRRTGPSSGHPVPKGGTGTATLAKSGTKSTNNPPPKSGVGVNHPVMSGGNKH